MLGPIAPAPPPSFCRARELVALAMRFFRNDSGNPDAYYEPNSMGGVPKEIVDRQLAHFREVDPEYAEGVERALEASGAR